MVTKTILKNKTKYELIKNTVVVLETIKENEIITKIKKALIINVDNK